MFRLNLIDSVAHPCKIVNEDLFDCNDQAAWIFDGASGIGPKIMTHAPTDPYWLVQTYNTELKKVWDKNRPIKNILEDAAEGTIEQFRIYGPDPAPPMIDRPTACMLMARLWEDKLELLGVGDCYLLHRSGITVTEFGSRIGEAAAPVHRERERLKAAGVAGKDLVELLIPLERQVRAKANIDGGYAILDLTTRWIDRMSEKVCDIQSGDSLLLMTDGFYRLIDTFKVYTPVSLIEAAKIKGLASLFAELRSMEDSDEECAVYPRIKIRDDVAAALLTIEKSS